MLSRSYKISYVQPSRPTCSLDLHGPVRSLHFHIRRADAQTRARRASSFQHILYHQNHRCYAASTLTAELHDADDGKFQRH